MTVCAKFLDAASHLGLIDGEQRHDEVVLLEGLTLRVHAHENVGDHLLVSIRSNLKSGKKISFEAEKGIDTLLNQILFLVSELRLALVQARIESEPSPLTLVCAI